ncbi:MAG: hypothetical protein NT098_00450 [Candidatus Parcubacteria bacterium]|nr:hypothetical protein [Candidatus Parcubacteria bacterium]
MKKESKKEMTIEDLAVITQQGLADTNQRIEDLAVATQKGFEGMEHRMDKRFEEVNTRFEEMNERFDRVEHILYRGHYNRIEKLEDKIAQIQVILGKKLA